MSTWHQMNGTAVPLWHETLWTVVDDRPNGRSLSVSRYEDAKTANEVAERTGCYVIPPHKPLEPKRKYGKKP